jgi:hypothetical protein
VGADEVDARRRSRQRVPSVVVASRRARPCVFCLLFAVRCNSGARQRMFHAVSRLSVGGAVS